MATFAPEQIRAFLDRVGYAGGQNETPAPSGALLSDLHWAHLRSVPFENLDIVRLGREIVLDPGMLYGKIVGERRGGYCFEQHGLLAEVLTDIGFGVTRVMVQFIEVEGGLSPAFDHLALLVTVSGDGERWLVDVTGGRQGFARPLHLVADVEQPSPEAGAVHRLAWVDSEGRWELHAKVGEGDWEPYYTFDETPRELANFAGRNAFFQRDPSSHFRKGTLATVSRPGGRVTVTADRVIETVGDIRSEREITAEEVDAILASEFGIVLAGVPGDGPTRGAAR